VDWTKVKFADLVVMMVDVDLELADRDRHLLARSVTRTPPDPAR
jgi:hypothetical protein